MNQEHHPESDWPFLFVLLGSLSIVILIIFGAPLYSWWTNLDKEQGVVVAGILALLGVFATLILNSVLHRREIRHQAELVRHQIDSQSEILEQQYNLDIRKSENEKTQSEKIKIRRIYKRLSVYCYNAVAIVDNVKNIETRKIEDENPKLYEILLEYNMNSVKSLLLQISSETTNMEIWDSKEEIFDKSHTILELIEGQISAIGTYIISQEKNIDPAHLLKFTGISLDELGIELTHIKNQIQVTFGSEEYFDKDLFDKLDHTLFEAIYQPED